MARRRKAARKRRGCFVLPLLLLLAFAAGGWWLWRGLFAPFHGYQGSERLFTVERGAPVARILRRLEEDGLIADARLARLYYEYRLARPALKAGIYRFEGALTAPRVLAKLAAGEVEQRTVTLIEGLTLEETAKSLADQGAGRLEAFLTAMRDAEAIADLDPDAQDLEGYLFPDTYQLALGLPEEEIVGALVATFRRRWEADAALLLPQPAGRTVREVVTLASIVEKEARLDEERPIIAGVYANRLQQGIGLYADPTVIFALKRLGRWDGNLRKNDLALESPYNTYRVAGLPPGPIASPGAKSLAAAARPAAVKFLYFVSRNDGSHVFAETLSEHNANVERWQRRYWRERWAAERAAKPGR